MNCIAFLSFRFVGTLIRSRSAWRQGGPWFYWTWRTCMRACMMYSTSTTSIMGGVAMLTSACRPTGSSAECTTTSSECAVLFISHTSSVLSLSSLSSSFSSIDPFHSTLTCFLPSLPSSSLPPPCYQANCDSREEDSVWEISHTTHQPSGEALCPHLLHARKGRAGCATPLPGLDTPVLQCHQNIRVRASPIPKPYRVLAVAT